jgi:hypothetical protein
MLWSAAVGAPVLDIRSETQCPAAEQVEERVRHILDLKDERIEERAIITRQERSLRVVFRAADGRDLAERVLSTDASCEDLAQAVAIVLATWISDVHPEYLGALPQPEGGSAANPPAPPSTAGDTRGDVPTAPTATTRFSNDIAPPDARPSESVPRRFELGLGVGAALPQASAAASILAAWVPTGSGLGLAAAATIATPREEPLADGRLQWRRWPVAGGLVLRAPVGRVVLDLVAGGALAWSHLTGRGFPSTSSADDFTLGAFASLRIAGASGRLVPFVAATGYGWLAHSVAFVRPEAGGDVELPRYDVLLLAGLAWRL